tara:strand:+ start:698 stop:829 length:132 start_codon:yes stop_codon:yes gene_type:complete
VSASQVAFGIVTVAIGVPLGDPAVSVCIEIVTVQVNAPNVGIT